MLLNVGNCIAKFCPQIDSTTTIVCIYKRKEEYTNIVS